MIQLVNHHWTDLQQRHASALVEHQDLLLRKKSSKHQTSFSDTFYQLNSMLSNRATHIGFGKKSDIALKNANPSPDKYDKPS